MFFTISRFSANIVTCMRNIGYIFDHKDGDEISFARPLASSGYPRFHVYMTFADGVLTVKMHIDHKKHTYGEATRHHGSYDQSDPVLANEVNRLRSFLERFSLAS